jgi:hypothetical protein
LTLPEGVTDARAFPETNSLVGPNGEQAPAEMATIDGKPVIWRDAVSDEPYDASKPYGAAIERKLVIDPHNPPKPQPSIATPDLILRDGDESHFVVTNPPGPPVPPRPPTKRFG